MDHDRSGRSVDRGGRFFYDAVRVSLSGESLDIEPHQIRQHCRGYDEDAAHRNRNEVEGLDWRQDQAEVAVCGFGEERIGVDVARANPAGLGNMKDESAIAPLIDALKDQDDWVRMNALGSLQKITGQDLRDQDAWRKWYQER